jgi:glycogen debranching enzyme
MTSYLFHRIGSLCLLAFCACTLASPPGVVVAATASGYSDKTILDLARVPFSRNGSYTAFSHLPKGPMGEGLYLRSVHGFVDRDLLLVELTDGETAVPFRETAHPGSLRLDAQSGFVEICISEPNVLRLHGHGVGLRLTKPQDAEGFAFQHDPIHWEFNAWRQDIRFMLTIQKGNLHVATDWDKTISRKVAIEFTPAASTKEFEGVMEEFRGTWHPRDYPGSFQDATDTVNHEYRQWLARMPTVPPEFQAAAELAAYQNWSAIVAPQEILRRPAMLMSKNWMASVWTWDPCFNAMALLRSDLRTAWDQYLVMFDQQTSDGDLPDQLNDRGSTWAFNKPPIHGWALAWMMKHGEGLDRQRLAEVYAPLSRWTDWFFQFRDDDRDGLPEYDHGNDTGWDNSTVFRTGPHAETPDLASFLVIQMQTLSEIAHRLGREAESKQWKLRADHLLSNLLAAFWKNGHFVALRPMDHSVIESDSLLLYLPIVLGKQLPPEIRSAMIADLKKEGLFLTSNGLATERLTSPYYQSKGYWRGPIWAPSTMIIVDGLEAAGEKDFARELKLRFCRMAAKNGFAENYDAVSGEAQDDPAYTWTSSVFLIFAHELSEP